MGVQCCAVDAMGAYVAGPPEPRVCAGSTVQLSVDTEPGLSMSCNDDTPLNPLTASTADRSPVDSAIAVHNIALPLIVVPFDLASPQPHTMTLSAHRSLIVASRFAGLIGSRQARTV